MQDNEILGLKRQSLKKWEKIVEDLQKPMRGLRPRLDCNACGYCRAYGVTNDHGLGIGCKLCPLNVEQLCFHGEGKAYLDVVDFYLPEAWKCSTVELSEALKQAQVMSEAIRKDVAECEKVVEV